MYMGINMGIMEVVLVATVFDLKMARFPVLLKHFD